MLFFPRTQHLTKMGPDMKKCGIWKQILIIDIRIVNVSWVGFMYFAYKCGTVLKLV